jgi:hypothetical protein
MKSTAVAGLIAAIAAAVLVSAAGALYVPRSERFFAFPFSEGVPADENTPAKKHAPADENTPAKNDAPAGKVTNTSPWRDRTLSVGSFEWLKAKNAPRDYAVGNPYNMDFDRKWKTDRNTAEGVTMSRAGGRSLDKKDFSEAKWNKYKLEDGGALCRMGRNTLTDGTDFPNKLCREILPRVKEGEMPNHVSKTADGTMYRMHCAGQGKQYCIDPWKHECPAECRAKCGSGGGKRVKNSDLRAAGKNTKILKEGKPYDQVFIGGGKFCVAANKSGDSSKMGCQSYVTVKDPGKRADWKFCNVLTGPEDDDDGGHVDSCHSPDDFKDDALTCDVCTTMFPHCTIKA